MKGVILAAGEGTRIREVTYGAIPKELLPIGNVPTIRFPLEALRLANVKDIIVVIAPHRKHGIVDALRSGSWMGVSICYVVQEVEGATGLGPAILSTKGWIGEGEDFVVACGDSILCDLKNEGTRKSLDCLKPLLKVHSSSQALATVLLYPMKYDPTRFGVVKFDHLKEEDGVFYGEIDGLFEKPTLEIAKKLKVNDYNYIIAGYYAFNARIFNYIKETKPGVKNEIQITDSMALALERGERIFGVVHGRKSVKGWQPCEYWDVGIPESYRDANKCLIDFVWK